MSGELRLPEKFLEQMKGILGPEFPDFLTALNRDPIVSLRSNPRKTTEIYPDSQPIPWCPTGKYLTERPKFVRDPLIHAGAYYVQEASSMLIAQCLSPEPGQKVLDLCAAPGGKSTLLLANLDDSSLLLSNELVGARAIVLKENLTRWGYPNSMVSHNHPRDFHVLPEFFDAVFVDAPCSGEGMFRKDPAIIERWSPSTVSECATTQKEILISAAVTLRTGGRLIYSTCTYNKQENEEIVHWLTTEAPGNFEIVPLDFPEEWGLEPGETQGFTPEMAHTYHCYPHKVPGEGFFLACLQKKAAVHGVSAPGERRKPNKHKKPAHRDEKRMKRGGRETSREHKPRISSKEAFKLAEGFLRDPDKFDLEIELEDMVARMKNWSEEIKILQDRLQVHKTGITVGKVNGRKFIPDHGLAMSDEVNPEIPVLELDYENAVRYLKRENVKTETGNLRGWALVAYRNVPLGWAKILENRINGHLPRSWRIRADVSEW